MFALVITKMNDEFEESDYEAAYEANAVEEGTEGLTEEQVTYITLILYNINHI